MSRYFDAATSRIRQLSDENSFDEHFVPLAKQLETQVVTDCLNLASDYEFPADLRDECYAIIRKHYILSAVIEDNPYLQTVRSSMVICRLHDLFHKVAERKIKTRFGLLFDDPGEALKLRLQQIVQPHDFD